VLRQGPEEQGIVGDIATRPEVDKRTMAREDWDGEGREEAGE